MKYRSFYFWFFSGTMKKTLLEKYDKVYVDEIMKKSKNIYKELVVKADDIGDDNPMAYNMLFALTFIAPYIASEKQIPPTVIQEMMRRSLYKIKWFFGLANQNTKIGKNFNKKVVAKYIKWYTPEKEKQYPTSFKIDYVGKPYEDACYYRITRCPICRYCKIIDAEEVMPLLCELDELMITLQQGVLYREHTIASGGPYCDYLIKGNKEK